MKLQIRAILNLYIIAEIEKSPESLLVPWWQMINEEKEQNHHPKISFPLLSTALSLEFDTG